MHPCHDTAAPPHGDGAALNGDGAPQNESRTALPRIPRTPASMSGNPRTDSVQPRISAVHPYRRLRAALYKFWAPLPYHQGAPAEVMVQTCTCANHPLQGYRASPTQCGSGISNPGSPQEKYRPFAEPWIFIVNEKSLVDISNNPFLRPELEPLISGIKWIGIPENNYPICGIYH